jgi:predicted acetyltransferase
MLDLVTPDTPWARSYIEALHEGFRRGLQPVTPPERIAAIAADFPRFLVGLLDQEQIITLPDGERQKTVPFSIHWMVEGETFIGEVSFRHVLNERLVQSGGNIGFGIRPAYEGKGYGKKMLALALDEARRRGLDRVLLTAHAWNKGSQGIIEANGGVLENVVEDINGGGPLHRYWIAL